LQPVAVVPVPIPAQLHVHGPVPEKLLTVPAEHKLLLLDDKVENVPPLAEPHAPLTAVTLAEQFVAFVPLVVLLQLHVHGPEPEKLPTVPAEHKLLLVDDRLENVPPLADPQAPLTFAIEHDASVPLYRPVQLHRLFVVVSVTSTKVPLVQPLMTVVLQAPFTFAIEHDASDPLFEPTQLQRLFADVSVMSAKVPLVQPLMTVVLQAPFTFAIEHDASEPPFMPAQVQRLLVVVSVTSTKVPLAQALLTSGELQAPFTMLLLVILNFITITPPLVQKRYVIPVFVSNERLMSGIERADGSLLLCIV
jgi:hypothetical protein